jgi:purine-cytosine permease-like protein
VIGIGLVAVVIFLIALSIPDSCLASFNTFVLLMLYFLVPWTAVNLADFYVVRKGQYAISDIQPRRHLRPMGQAGLVAYGLGMVSMIPFMSLSFYEGPVARALGGADITLSSAWAFPPWSIA